LSFCRGQNHENRQNDPNSLIAYDTQKDKSNPIMLKVRRRLRTSPGRGTVRRGKKEGTCAGAALAAPSVPDAGPDEQYPVRDLDAI